MGVGGGVGVGVGGGGKVSMVRFREVVSFVRRNAMVLFKVTPVSIKRPFAHQKLCPSLCCPLSPK